MASSPNLSEIVTTTLRNRSGELADNVSKGNALLARLSEKGNIKPAAGGRTIVKELDYAENATFQYYSGYEQINVSPSEVMSAAEYDWKQASVVVSASGLEIEVQNNSDEAVINLLEGRLTNAMRTFNNNITIGLYSDGSGTSGKQVDGLQAAVALDPTSGTYGSINRATYSFWQNQTSGNVANIDTTFATLKTEMEDMYLETSRGGDSVDFIIASQSLYQNYWNGLTDLQRYTSPDVGETGFAKLKFAGADVVYEDSTGIRADTMYFLNTDFICFQPHSDRNMVPLDRRESVNQDAIVIPILFAGNMTCSNASLQGVVYT
jgi:hypothetical protein